MNYRQYNMTGDRHDRLITPLNHGMPNVDVQDTVFFSCTNESCLSIGQVIVLECFLFIQRWYLKHFDSMRYSHARGTDHTYHRVT